MNYTLIVIAGIICTISGFVDNSDVSAILGAIFLSASVILKEINNKIK